MKQNLLRQSWCSIRSYIPLSDKRHKRVAEHNHWLKSIRHLYNILHFWRMKWNVHSRLWKVQHSSKRNNSTQFNKTNNCRNFGEEVQCGVTGLFGIRIRYSLLVLLRYYNSVLIQRVALSTPEWNQKLKLLYSNQFARILSETFSRYAMTTYKYTRDLPKLSRIRTVRA